MTLQDAYDIHVAKLHIRTIRRFLGWRVLNAANQNPRAVSLPSLSRGQPEGAGLASRDARPRIYPINPHTPAHTQVQP